jgi:serpin B
MKRFTLFALLAPALVPTIARAQDSVVNTRTEVVRGMTEFGLDLYGRLATERGNVFFSPYSISTALAMAHAGARGQTAEQMAAVLHLPAGGGRTGFAMLTRELTGTGRDRAEQLFTANALWGQRGLKLQPSFSDTLQLYFDAGLHEVDFVRATEKARGTINAWVDKQTRGHIRDLLAPGSLTPETQLVLTNAVYLNARWDCPFEKSDTSKGPFQVTADRKLRVPMMNQTAYFNYMETDSLQGLELLYRGNHLSLVVLLPRRPDGLAELEQALTPRNLSRWLKQLNAEQTIVALPRFQTTTTCQLASTLQAMGMKLAFTSGDFSRMVADERLVINAVVHKAFVAVDEQGTKAAAATAVELKKEEADPRRPKPKVFRADHPFIFLIRDRRSDCILFLGRVVDPTK